MRKPLFNGAPDDPPARSVGKEDKPQGHEVDKQGTIQSRVTMFGNLYPLEKALLLFGPVPGKGAQYPKPGMAGSR